MKILTVAGARPQFIKAAVMSRKFRQHEDIQELMIHTGQHYDKEMSADFFTELNIAQPAYNLGINNLPPAAMTGKMLQAIEPILVNEKPDMVIVYGDTNSTLAGALAAKKLNIPVAHIEAGLRSGDMKMPEELNRLITDRISTLLFCPTVLAAEKLRQESFEEKSIHLVGDIMFDAALQFAGSGEPPAGLKTPYVICTFHRRELIRSKEKLIRLLGALCNLHEEIPVVLIMHPHSKQAIDALLITLPFTILPPLSYVKMSHALQHAACVITDSGGLQKEAYFFKKPCITIRNNTEWRELVDAGVNFLAGDDGAALLHTYDRLKTATMDFSAPFYGDGNTSERILDAIRTFFKEQEPNEQ